MTHFIPKNDRKEHQKSKECQCHPVIKRIGETGVVFHRAWNGSEPIDRMNRATGQWAVATAID